MQDMPTSSGNIIRKKPILIEFLLSCVLFRDFFLMMTDTKSWPCLIASKRGQLEACRSAQASFVPFSLKVG